MKLREFIEKTNASIKAGEGIRLAWSATSNICRLFPTLLPKEFHYEHERNVISIYTFAKDSYRAKAGFDLTIRSKKVGGTYGRMVVDRIEASEYSQRYLELEMKDLYAQLIAEAKSAGDYKSSAIAKRQGEFNDKLKSFGMTQDDFNGLKRMERYIDLG